MTWAAYFICHVLTYSHTQEHMQRLQNAPSTSDKDAAKPACLRTVLTPKKTTSTSMVAHTDSKGLHEIHSYQDLQVDTLVLEFDVMLQYLSYKLLRLLSTSIGLLYILVIP